jgi:hypothetical protein
MQNVQTLEIMKLISTLPPEKLAEVRDFAQFLRDKYVDEDYSDEWSDEDMRDFAAASLQYFEDSEEAAA